MWVLFVARNREFIRDKAGFGWNILFPFLIVAGFGIVFSGDTRTDYKVGVFPVATPHVDMKQVKLPSRLKGYQYIHFIPFKTFDTGLDRLVHHKIDILIKNDDLDFSYWISDSSPKGYVMEKVVRESLVPETFFQGKVKKKEIQSDQIRYIDWLFPGILGMNIMFSAMFGVGYIIVRYRKKWCAQKTESNTGDRI